MGLGWKWSHESEAFKCLITLKCQTQLICDVICTAIDINFTMSMWAMSPIYSTFDIANIEGAQLHHPHCSNRCHVAILVGKTTTF